MQDCLFCKILNGDIPANKVYEDEKIFVFHDIAPKATHNIRLAAAKRANPPLLPPLI